MKRTVALILVLVLCLALTAGCKKNQAVTASPADVAGQTQTAGDVTVFVPAGWTLVADQADPGQVYLCKGGSDLNKYAYVKLTGNGVLPAEGTCTDVQTLDARTYGELSWSGFSGTKPAGNVIYLVSKTESGSILATLWYTEASGALSLDDKAVQAILSKVSVATSAEPAPTPAEPGTTADLTSIAGDWAGTLEFMDCSDAYEEKNGLTCQAIARILIDENGNMTPYIGLAPEGGTIKGLTAPAVQDEMGAGLSGTWEGIPFGGCELILKNGELTLYIPIETENGNALLSFTFKPLTDGSFETLASQLGCTGYPTAD